MKYFYSRVLMATTRVFEAAVYTRRYLRQLVLRRLDKVLEAVAEENSRLRSSQGGGSGVLLPVVGSGRRWGREMSDPVVPTLGKKHASPNTSNRSSPRHRRCSQATPPAAGPCIVTRCRSLRFHPPSGREWMGGWGERDRWGVRREKKKEEGQDVYFDNFFSG